jgi:predicted amidohydrolase
MATTTTTTRTKIAVAQLCSTDSKVQNLVTIARLARRASQEHCRFLFLPECFGFMGSNAGQTLQNAEDNDFHSNPPALTEALVDIVQNDLKGNDENENRNNELLSYPNSQISLYRAMETIAKTSKLWISAGGMHVKSSTSSVPDPSSDDSPNNDSSIPYKVYNTHFIWDDQGRSVAEYPKIHLFDVTLPTVDLRESKTTLPGTKLVVCRDTPIGTYVA